MRRRDRVLRRSGEGLERKNPALPKGTGILGKDDGCRRAGRGVPSCETTHGVRRDTAHRRTDRMERWQQRRQSSCGTAIVVADNGGRPLPRPGGWTTGTMGVVPGNDGRRRP